jgi:hypothetical protein
MSEGESFSVETKELRRLARDLVALSTLPAIWEGRDLRQITESLAEVLLSTLSLDFVYLTVPGPDEGDALELARTAQQPEAGDLAQRLGNELASWLASGASPDVITIPDPLGSGTVQLAIFP